MKHNFWLFLSLILMMAVSANAVMAQGSTPGLADIFETVRDEKKSDRKDRRKTGAGLWGGPYWGYGPRWGNPCAECAENCKENSRSARCKRCKIRCDQ